MTLTFGQRMVRVDDGMQGQVIQNGPDLRIAYLDRGEERIALKSERWVPDELKPGPLRAQERLTIAHYADRALRAYERNEPHKTWEPPDLRGPIYDLELVNLITRYLAERETRAAG